MWANLRECILRDFEEAQSSGRPRRIWFACLNHSAKLERRRRWYALAKQVRPAWHARFLANRREYALRYRLEHPEWYQAKEAAKKERNAVRRAARTRDLVCAKCHKNFLDRSGIGPIPKYCSTECNRRAAGLAYYYRQKNKGGASGKFFVTPHAVHRYQERVHHGISYEKALSEIIEEAERAHYVKPYKGGAQCWRGAKPMRLRLVVSPPNGKGKLPQIITVLPASDRKRDS